jgi:hypothetical protein
MEAVKRVQFPEPSVPAAFHARRHGAFGEIAPPRRCSGEVDFSATRMQPNDFLGRDRSPSGPSPWYCPSRLPPMESDVSASGPSLGYWIGRVALFVMFADMALSEKSPHLGGALGEVDFSATRRPPNDFLGRDRSPSGPSPGYCPSRLPPMESDVSPSGPCLRRSR